MTRIRIVVVDGQALVREGLAALLAWLPPGQTEQPERRASCQLAP